MGAPVQQTVEWSVDGETYEIDVYVRRFSYATAIADMESLRDGDSTTAKRITTSIVDEHGEPIFSVGDITGDADAARGAMSQDMVMALLGAIYRANDMGKSSGQTTSTKEPKSGASLSSTESVETQSSKRKKT